MRDIFWSVVECAAGFEAPTITDVSGMAEGQEKIADLLQADVTEAAL